MKEEKGGARKGAGRPKLEVKRERKTLRAFDDEWELIHAFSVIVKKDRARAERILKTE